MTIDKENMKIDEGSHRPLIVFVVVDLKFDSAVAVFGLASGAQTPRLHRRERAFDDFPEIPGIYRVALPLLAKVSANKTMTD